MEREGEREGAIIAVVDVMGESAVLQLRGSFCAAGRVLCAHNVTLLKFRWVCCVPGVRRVCGLLELRSEEVVGK